MGDIVWCLSDIYASVFQPIKHRVNKSTSKVFALVVPGDLTPHLGYPLVGVFLQGTKDPDPSIRASSLSNLGALCQGLDYSLGPLAPEVRRLPASQATFVSRNAQQVAMFGENSTSCLHGDVFKPLNGGFRGFLIQTIRMSKQSHHHRFKTHLDGPEGPRTA